MQGSGCAAQSGSHERAQAAQAGTVLPRSFPPSLILSLGEWSISRSHPSSPSLQPLDRKTFLQLPCAAGKGNWAAGEWKGRIWISVRDGQVRHWECFHVSGSFGGMSAEIAVRKFPVTLVPKLLRYEKTSCPLFPAFSTKTFLLFFPLINKLEFEQSLWVLCYFLQSSWHLFPPTKGLPACPGLK